MTTALEGWPQFAQELFLTLPVHPHFVLWGNHRDRFLVEEPGVAARLMTLDRLLCELLARSGCPVLLWQNLLTPGRLLTRDEPRGTEPGAETEELYGGANATTPTLTALGEQAGRLARPEPVRRGGLVFDLSNRIGRAGPAEAEERDFFRTLDRLATSAARVRNAPAEGVGFNPVITVIDTESELPAYYTSGNPRVRSIAVPLPDRGSRQRVGEKLLAERYRDGEPDLDGPAAVLAGQTDGMSLTDLTGIVHLGRHHDLPPAEIGEAVRIYKFGVPRKTWQQGYLRKQIAERSHLLEERVLGQHRAIAKVQDLLKRAVLGLSGAHLSRAGNRPRGVLFLAGPTGVGKTELAKALASLIFGDDDAYIRFDMSEFSAEHAGDRLIGAPPGYVGHDAGGELTNAIRQNPFRVVLFDEIEKAAGGILDKFLQILEDGRLTDGRGNTAHFSDTVLVFTSNLGMYGQDRAGRRIERIPFDTEYDLLDSRIREGIAEHFTGTLGRPELLNRFGDSIVVFDFIRPAVAARIFDLQVANVAGRLADEHGLILEFAAGAREAVRDACVEERHRRNGGRGIGNAVETVLTNPMSRYLFDVPVERGRPVRVLGLVPSYAGPEARLEVSA